MPMLGLDVPRTVLDELFDSWDPDGSGSIDQRELNKMLRRGREITGLDPRLQPGAVPVQLSPRMVWRPTKSSATNGGYSKVTQLLFDSTASTSTTHASTTLRR